MYWHPMWDGAWGAGWGAGWGVMGLLHVLWWVLLVAGAVVLFRTIVGDRRQRGSDTALDILRERYARGEIDAAEYDERRKQLKGS